MLTPVIADEKLATNDVLLVSAKNGSRLLAPNAAGLPPWLPLLSTMSKAEPGRVIVIVSPPFESERDVNAPGLAPTPRNVAGVLSKLNVIEVAAACCAQSAR